MKKYFQKTILIIFIFFGLLQSFAQGPQSKKESSTKIQVLEECFNSQDKLVDKVTIITENDIAQVYYQQNLGNDIYTPLIKVDTIVTPRNDVISLISYNSKTGSKDIIVGERNNHNPTKLDLSRSQVISIDSISKNLLRSSNL